MQTQDFSPPSFPPLQTLSTAPRGWFSWLLPLSFLMYIATRLVALDAFPIYFFTDEAVQTVLASDLLRDHLFSYDHEFLPTFFKNGAQYNLGLSVYWQMLPTLLLGKSIWVTRGAAALATGIAALSVALLLKHIFRSLSPWMGVLFLSITPAWFLHSRTAFETSLAVSFYALFLYFYLMYRCHNPKYLFAAVLAAALTFYAYTPARVVIAVTLFLLLLSDFRYHLRHKWIGISSLALGIILTLPFLRFLLAHAAENAWSMRLLGSYWVMDLPLLTKLGMYAQKYLAGLNPLYWYFPNGVDLARHVMLGYGHLLTLTLPLGALGVALALWRIKCPEWRALLCAILAAPTGAAMVEVGITRVLFMVIPLAFLTALALEEIICYVCSRWKNLPQKAILAGCFLLLCAVNVGMLADALIHAPTWYADYSLTGMQYGARQLFAAVADTLRDDPRIHLIVSPTWANGTDVLARFFFDDPLPYQLGTAQEYYRKVGNLTPQTQFVMTPEEFAAIPRQKFAEIRVVKTLLYPNGRPGFLFVQLQYKQDIAAIIAAERAAHEQLVEDTVQIDGQPVRMLHSRADIGKPQDVFDGSLTTLFRTDALNPLKIQLIFPSPRRIHQVSLQIGGVPTAVRVQGWDADNRPLFDLRQSAGEAINPRLLTVNLGGEYPVETLWLEVRNVRDNEEGNVHLWEVTLK